MEKNYEFTLLLDFYGDILTQKQKELSEMYYNEDMSLTEISEIEGITRQGVRDCIKRSEQIMLDMEQKVGFCKKFAQYRAGAQKIIEIASQVAEKNRGYTYSAATDEGTGQIIEIAKTFLE